MNRNLSAVSALALLSPWMAASAHHGTAGYYDHNKLVTIEGVVKEFQWRNPHSGLFLVSKDASGKEILYSLEMGSPAALSKAGFTRKTFKVGDKVSAEIHPSFGSPTSGEVFSGKVKVNGQVLSPGGKGAAGEDYSGANQ